MTTAGEQYLEVPEAFYRNVFSWIWRVAIALALAFGISATVWPEYEKPLIVVPLAAAGVGGAILGWIGAGRYREEIVREFTSNFWLQLKSTDDRDISAVDLFEEVVPDLKDRRKIYRLRTTQGKVYILHIQRFIELLVTRSMDEVATAAEHAIVLSWQRCLGELRPDLTPMMNKTFREVFKGDISGSFLAIISRVGDKLAKELAETAEPEEISTEPFTLEPLSPFSNVGLPRGRSKR